MVLRVSTLNVHQKTVSDISRLQLDLATARNQISSGVKAEKFSQLGGDTVRMTDLQLSLNNTSRFISKNNQVVSRIKAMDGAVQTLVSLASDLASQLALENSANGEINPLTTFARDALGTVSDVLNTTLAGRQLFSGSKTTTPAVDPDALVDTTNIVNGVPTDNYYQGNEEILSVRVNKQLDMEYGILGNDPAFQDLIGALHEAIKGDRTVAGPAGDQEALNNAVGLVNSAIAGLSRVRNDLNTDILALQTANSQHSRVKIQLQDALNDVIGADVVDLSIQVSLNEAVLTATLQTFSRVSQLTLVQFLR